MILSVNLRKDYRRVIFWQLVWWIDAYQVASVFVFVFWKVRPNLRGGNSYHSSFDDPLGKGAAHEADVTTR